MKKFFALVAYIKRSNQQSLNTSKSTDTRFSLSIELIFIRQLYFEELNNNSQTHP